MLTAALAALECAIEEDVERLDIYTFSDTIPYLYNVLKSNRALSEIRCLALNRDDWEYFFELASKFIQQGHLEIHQTNKTTKPYRQMSTLVLNGLKRPLY